MSRPYKFYINIHEAMGASLCQEIEEALVDECFDDIEWHSKGHSRAGFEASGFYNLGGGRTVEEEVKKLRSIIWALADRYIEVSISVTYMPGDHYGCDESDYAKWIEEGGKSAKRCKCGDLLDDDEELCWHCQDED